MKNFAKIRIVAMTLAVLGSLGSLGSANASVITLQTGFSNAGAQASAEAYRSVVDAAVANAGAGYEGPRIMACLAPTQISRSNRTICDGLTAILANSLNSPPTSALVTTPSRCMVWQAAAMARNKSNSILVPAFKASTSKL